MYMLSKENALDLGFLGFFILEFDFCCLRFEVDLCHQCCLYSI